MAPPANLRVLAPLPALAGYRRALAAEGPSARGAVVVAFPPAEVAGDPARLGALCAAVEAAGRVRHPGVAAVLGTTTVEGALAVVEEHRPGVALRALLDAGGRTPPDVGAAIGIGAARALAQLHAAEGGAGKLAHGALDAAGVVLSDGGEVFLSGAGLTVGDPEADLHALGAALHECLAGEPPSAPPRRLDVPGVPAALAAVVDRATGAAPAGYASAAALAEAIADAVAAPATPGEVAAYLDAILPPDEGERAALRQALAGEPPAEEPPAAEVEVVEPTPAAGSAAPEVQIEPTPAAGSVAPGPAATSGSARTSFPRPAAPPPSSRLVPAVVGLLAFAAGFGAGFVAQRRVNPPQPSATPEPAAEVRARPERASDPAAPPSAAQPPATETSPAPPPRAAPAPPPEPHRAPAKAPKRATRQAGKGTLSVTAPDDADVLLDGRRVGRGRVKLDVPAGPHRIEVRRAGATVRERFTLAPGENWTYDVTPTPAEPTGAR